VPRPNIDPDCVILGAAYHGWDCSTMPGELRGVVAEVFEEAVIVLDFERRDGNQQIHAELRGYTVLLVGRVGPDGAWREVREASATPIE
jgi:hypothetical protein